MTNYVNSVQQVSITVASGATTGTASISATTGTPILIYQGNASTATTSNAQAFARASLSGTTITGTRTTSSTNTCTITAAVIDADATNLVQSVQMGTIALSAAQGSNTATISSVTTANSAIAILGYNQATTTYHYDINSMVLALTNATTVTATSLQGAGAALTVGYVVVEFKGTALNQAKQAFAKSFTNTTGSSTQALTSVNVANSMIFYAGGGSPNGDVAADEQPLVTLTNGTTATVSVGNTASGNVVQCNFTVIEFVSGVLSQTAQRGTIAISSGSSNTASITSSATATTLLNPTGWKSTSTATTSHANIRPDITQTSATVVTAAISGTIAGVTTYGYEALNFTAGGGGGSRGLFLQNPMNGLGVGGSFFANGIG